MSVRVMADVWECSKQEGSALVVLLALADWANDERQSWPKTETLAAKARVSTRQLSRILKELAEEGELLVPAGPRSEDRPYEIRQYGDSTPVSDLEGTRMADSARARADAVEPPEEPPEGAGDGQLFQAPSPEVVVWEHWCDASGKRERRFDATSRKLVRSALKVRKPEVCIAAIDGYLADPWWREHTSKELRHALKGNSAKGESDADRIDKMAALPGTSSANDSTTVQSVLATFPSDAQTMVRDFMQTVEQWAQNPQSKSLTYSKDQALRMLANAGVEPTMEGDKLTGWKRAS